MSSLPKHQNKNICYRCRNTFKEGNDLLKCTKCPSFWHLECTSFHSESKPTDGWICPQHQKISKRTSFSRKRVAKIRARQEMIEEFEVAEQIIKYGGVKHELSIKTMESDFINYAKRYRMVQYPLHNSDRIYVEPSIDECNLKPKCLEYQDGIQMLLDAANTYSEET